MNHINKTQYNILLTTKNGNPVLWMTQALRQLFFCVFNIEEIIIHNTTLKARRLSCSKT